LGIRSKLRTQRFQRGLPDTRDDGDGRWSMVEGPKSIPMVSVPTVCFGF
jgi:hypothetical protein